MQRTRANTAPFNVNKLNIDRKLKGKIRNTVCNNRRKRDTLTVQEQSRQTQSHQKEQR